MVACWLEPHATLQWQAGQPEVLACNLDDAFTLISSTLGNVKAAAHALPSVTEAVTGAEHQLGRLEQPMVRYARHTRHVCRSYSASERRYSRPYVAHSRANLQQQRIKAAALVLQQAGYEARRARTTPGRAPVA